MTTTESPEFRRLYDALQGISHNGFGADVDADSIVEDAARAHLARLAVADHLTDMAAAEATPAVPIDYSEWLAPLEQVGYRCIQDHPNRICSGCTSGCNEPVFMFPETKEDET